MISPRTPSLIANFLLFYNIVALGGPLRLGLASADKECPVSMCDAWTTRKLIIGPQESQEKFAPPRAAGEDLPYPSPFWQKGRDGKPSPYRWRWLVFPGPTPSDSEPTHVVPTALGACFLGRLGERTGRTVQTGGRQEQETIATLCNRIFVLSGRRDVTSKACNP